VTTGKAALQPQSVGASHAATGHSTKAQPLSSLREPAELNVIEEAGVTAVASKTKHRDDDGNTASKERHDAAVMMSESAKFELLSRTEAFEIVKRARALMAKEKAAREIRKDTPASEKTLRDYAKKCARIDAEIAQLQEPWSHPIGAETARALPGHPHPAGAGCSAEAW
jgi:hypothetical protein